MIQEVVKFFNRLEIRVRGKLSHYPVLYALFGAIGIVLFWRGIWHTADDINMSSLFSLILGFVILVLIGVFVAEFIGNKLIISGLIGEKKLASKEEGEIETEESQLKNLQSTLSRLEKKLEHIDAEIDAKK